MENPSASMRYALGSSLLRALLALSLIYYAAMVLDLVLSPSAVGVGYDAFPEGNCPDSCQKLSDFNGLPKRSSASYT